MNQDLIIKECKAREMFVEGYSLRFIIKILKNEFKSGLGDRRLKAIREQLITDGLIDDMKPKRKRDDAYIRSNDTGDTKGNMKPVPAPKKKNPVKIELTGDIPECDCLLRKECLKHIEKYGRLICFNPPFYFDNDDYCPVNDYFKKQ